MQLYVSVSSIPKLDSRMCRHTCTLIKSESAFWAHSLKKQGCCLDKGRNLTVKQMGDIVFDTSCQKISG